MTTSWRAYLVIFAVFVLGAVCGAGAAVGVVSRVQRHILAGPDPVARIATLRLAHELRLDRHQREQVRDAILESRTELHAVLAQNGPELLGIWDRTAAKIRTALNERQRERFDALAAARRGPLEHLIGAEQPVPPPPPTPVESEP